MVKRKGFTLIELVMVIVIIGILAAIAIPRFVDLRLEAQQAACRANEGAIRSALAAFYARSAVRNLVDATPDFYLPTLLASLDTTVNRHTPIDFFVGVMPTNAPDVPAYTYQSAYNTATGVLTSHAHP